MKEEAKKGEKMMEEEECRLAAGLTNLNLLIIPVHPKVISEAAKLASLSPV